MKATKKTLKTTHHRDTEAQGKASNGKVERKLFSRSSAAMPGAEAKIPHTTASKIDFPISLFSSDSENRPGHLDPLPESWAITVNRV